MSTDRRTDGFHFSELALRWEAGTELTPAGAGAKAVLADLDSPDSVPRFWESYFPAAASTELRMRCRRSKDPTLL